MGYKLVVKILKDEYWYGGNVFWGWRMPFTRNSLFAWNDQRNRMFNQAAPFFVSSKGRYIWSEDGFSYKVIANKFICKSKKSEIKLYDGFQTLKGAFLAASKAHFPANGKMPPDTMFSKPQYCTWIELLDNQNQKDVLSYAKSIKDAGMPIGEIIIDDGWQNKFGDWVFKKETFPDPKYMIDELKKMGFTVSLWICPFVSVDTPDYQKLVDNNALVKDKKGKIAHRRWWNGVDPVLDFTNDYAVKWFFEKCQWLIDEYGIKGFKQDAGDPLYYRDHDITTKLISANGQCELWAKSALSFEYNELRACWKCGGIGVAQRLADKAHLWNRIYGIRALIPNMQQLGIIGHPYGCPDMVGGGLEIFFDKPEEKYDHELFVRSAQCSAVMPMMQYSLSIWALKDKKYASLCIDAANYHQKFVDYILEVARQSKTTGEPIIRYMEYEFPNEQMHKAKQQFMLGDRYLVAPMVWKRKKKREVYLPEGQWRDVEATENEIFEGGQIIEIEIPLEKLLILEKVK